MEPDLIDTYVAALRTRLHWRPDVEDVADEVADHLREHADRLTARGTPACVAQQRALDDFGDPELVAELFSRNDSGALAGPTRGTRLAGGAGVAAAVAWSASAVAAVSGGHTDVVVPWDLQRYQVWVGLLTVAFALTTATVGGALLRVGRLRTPSGLAALAGGALLTAAMYPLGWAVTTITWLLAVPVLLAFRGSGPWDGGRVVRPVRLLAVWPLGGAALLLFDEVVPVGPADAYGDHQIAWLVPFLGCALCSAWALALAGVRLRAEQPAEPGAVPCPPGTPALV